MAKSRARFLAEVLGTTGLVKKSKSALAGADEVIDLTSLPSLPNSKLTNSSISIAGHSTALGGSVALDTADIGEDTNLYFTTARARGAISVSGNAISYNSSTGVLTSNFEEGPVFTGSVTAAGLTSSSATNINAAFTVKNNYNETKFVRNADVSSVGAAGYYLSIGALNGSSVVTPNVINAVTDTDGTSSSFAIMQDGANSLSFNSSKNATFSGHVTISGTNNFYVGDNGKFIAGANDDLQIYHDGSNSFIKNITNDLYLDTASGSIHFTKGGTSEVMASFNTDGAVTLRHNNVTKFTTTSTGIDVTGTAVVDGLTSSGAVTSTSGSNSFGATTFTSGITIAGLTSSAAVTSTTSNSNAFGGTNFTGTVSVSGNTLSDTSRNVYTNNISAAGNVTVTGNLTVSGTTTTLNTATLDVEDKNITLNYGTGDTSSSANGAGITIQDAEDSSTNATILWSAAGNNFNVSHSWNTLGYLQHTGVLYSRNDLLVLNTAGNGWNTWATRSSGNFNLNVGTVTTSGLIKTTSDVEIASSQPRLHLNRGNGSYSWNIYNGNGSGNFPTSTFNIANNAGTAVITALDNGNVGIGITNPDQSLMVKGTIETQATNSTNGWQLYTHTDNTFRVNYNGAGSDEVMIHSDGRVGVATTSPVSGHKLTVNGKIGGPTFVDSYLHFDHSTGDTILKANDDLILGYSSGVRIRNSGKVGINESNPYSLLHITRTATDAYTASAFNDAPLITLEHTNADTQYAGIRFTNAVGNYEHFLGSVQTGANTADMVFQGYDRAATAYKEYLRINDGGNVGIGVTTPANALSVNGVITSGNFTAASISGTPGDANTAEVGPGYINLARDDTADAAQIRFGKNGAVHSYLETRTNGLGFITNVGDFAFEGGNVGIGTTSPNSPLAISNLDNGTSFSSNRVLQLIGTSTTDGSRVSLAFSGNTSIGNGLAIIEAVNDDQSAGHTSLHMHTYNGSWNTENLVLKGGNVGIGVATPDLKLHVDGTNSYPATSGTTPNGMLSLRSKTAGASHGFYMGVANAAPWGTWLQAADANNLATEYPLLLNPNGGNVGIGLTDPGNPLTVKAANCTIDAQSTADGQTIGFRAGYLNHATLHGLFRYTTGDAQLYIDNDFIGNNGVYSDINFRNKSTATNGSLINRLKIKGSTGHVGIGTTTPQHQLVVQHDSDPSIYIVGNGYNDTVRLGFGGGDVNSVMGSGNTGAIISSAQTTSSGQALGDLRFQINKGDSLQTALHFSNQGFATFDHQGSDYGIAIKTSGSSRSGLVIMTPATNTVTASALVLSDTTFRLGTAGNYHQRMDQDGKTQIGFDKQVSIGDHYGNSYTAARFNINAGSGTGDGATGKTGWYGPRGRGHKSFAGQDAFNIYDQQREWTGKHIDAGGNSVNQTSSQNYTNDHGLQCNYPSDVTSQQLIYSDTPKGGAGTILRAQANTSSAWNGGFQSNTFPCNPHVGLQYSMYVRRASSQSSGSFFMGCHNAYPGGTSTTVNTNPYFYVTSMSSLPQGVWCLVVAYLAPINYTGSEPGYTGIYRLDTGDRLVGQTLFRHYSTTQTIRTYMYYAGDGLTKCDWYAPRLHLVDGTEPSITQLMGYGRVYGSNVDL